MTSVTPIINSNARPLSKQGGLRKAFGYIGRKLPDSFTKYTELSNSAGLQRLTFILVAALFVLGVRYVKSRDEHERREVLTRDGITIGATVSAVPFLKKVISTVQDKVTKLPITIGSGKLKDAPSYKNLEHAYTKVEELPETLYTFAKNIVDKKGDLSRVFDVLGEDTKAPLEALLKGKEKTSENILNAIKEATEKTKNFTVEADGLKDAGKKIIDVLSKKDNALVKKINRLKSVPDIAAILLTTGFLGWGIPKFNIWYTGQKFKKQADKQNAEANVASTAQMNQLFAVNAKDEVAIKKQTIINNYLNK